MMQSSDTHEVVAQATQSPATIPKVNVVLQGGGVKQEQDDTTITWVQAAVSIPFPKLVHELEMRMAVDGIDMLLSSSVVEHLL